MQPGSGRLWGRMSAPQAVAHGALSFEMALADRLPPPMVVGRIIGGLVKRFALRNDEPMGRDSPTMPDAAGYAFAFALVALG